MDEKSARSEDTLTEKAAAEDLKLTVKQLKHLENLDIIEPVSSTTRPSVKELGLPPQDNPENEVHYRKEDIERLKNDEATLKKARESWREESTDES